MWMGYDLRLVLDIIFQCKESTIVEDDLKIAELSICLIVSFKKATTACLLCSSSSIKDRKKVE